ncbi:DNA-binding response regulator [Hymenobacter frigidus]|uniref:DNA-binding response regulator n=1 Tax=Hymenobacter frigidus TaxID=1524095 RepID=A0ABQ2A978_9BACT|nr:LytTR family DNA-binding domain-containing protein [Hymenobacter frigidus]GGH88512.1 DNA-binding response regulator [Hymenobacter frigidus]
MAIEKRLSCIIIDDEPLAQDLLKKYTNRLSFLELTTIFDNAVEALSQMETLRPDIILLDVNMPEMSGIEFLKTFSNFQPAVILTTAYSEYALEGFEHNVADFILKPIVFERFVKAINKAREKIGAGAAVLAEPQRMLLIKENKRFIRVALDDVLFVEGMKDYLKIHTKTKVIITHMTMTKMETMLDKATFLRVNRSYIVQKAAIKAITGNVIETINNAELPIGVNYRESIRKMTEKGIL